MLRKATQYMPILEADQEKLTFDKVLKKYNKLSENELANYSNLYTNDLLKLYKTYIINGSPVFSNVKLYDRLILALPNETLTSIKIFKLVAPKDDITLASINYSKPVRLAKSLVLNYSQNFVELVLPYQTERIQSIYGYLFNKYMPVKLKKICKEMINKQKTINKEYEDPIIYNIFKLTKGYEPITIILSEKRVFMFSELLRRK